MTTTSDRAEPVTTIAPTTTTAPLTSTTTTATTTTEGGADIEVSDGLVDGPDRFQYAKGEAVAITVVADTAYEVHVHGYDHRFDLEPGMPLTIEFPADVPGIFEVETHPGHILLFELEVSG